ncbi:MAG: ATP-binding cassette domain-containing protein [Bauldia sp.]
MSLAVEARNLSIAYGSQTVVRGLSFSLEAGKIHGLLGRNGSGKTTLLSVIAALRQPNSGTILVGGEAPYETPRVTHEVALIRASGDVPDSCRVGEALAVAARFRPHWDQAFADRLLDRFKIARRKRYSTLSRGQQSAVGIVLGLASRAPLTLFDEAYLGLDAPGRYVFYQELLDDYIAHPRTIVLSTHLIEEVADLFESVLMINDGTLLIHDSADALRTRGAAIIGPAEAVDAATRGLTILNSRSLGRTKSVTVYGDIDDDSRRRIASAGIEVAPVPLQDLFVHLTAPSEVAS